MDSQTADMPKEAVDVNACCLECIDELGGKQKEGAVSYTHLDVYKRQVLSSSGRARHRAFASGRAQC